MTTTNYELPVDDLELSEKAEAILAARNRARGKAPGDWTDEEYAEALVEAAEAPETRPGMLLRNALEESGYMDPHDEVVSHALLERRARQIQIERFGVEDESGQKTLPAGWDDNLSEDDRLDPYRQAIEELGTPGEKRKDLNDPKPVAASSWSKARAAGIVALGMANGSCPANQAAAWQMTAEVNPVVVAKRFGVTLEEAEEAIPPEMLPSIYRDPAVCDLARDYSVQTGEHVIRPDEEGLLAMLRAEEVLKAQGKANRYGEIEYGELTQDEYFEALQAGGAL